MPTEVKVCLGKHAQIIDAARENFLRNGYAGASMDAIAGHAGVAIKTVYSHFLNKGELFSAVMKEACSTPMRPEDHGNPDALQAIFKWFNDASQQGLRAAGQAYLDHLLSEEQLALYRVVTRDSCRFPELGELYEKNVARGRTELLNAFLERTVRVKGWRQQHVRRDTRMFEALLRSEIFERALHGLREPTAEEIGTQAWFAAETIWDLMEQAG